MVVDSNGKEIGPYDCKSSSNTYQQHGKNYIYAVHYIVKAFWKFRHLRKLINDLRKLIYVGRKLIYENR